MGQLLEQALPQHAQVLEATHCPSSSPAPPLQPHQALPPKEVGDHVFIQVVDKASGVIAATVDEELLPGVLIDEGADLKWGRWSKMKSWFFIEK